MFYFQSGQLGHSTNTIILKSNDHKSHAWDFNVIFTFQSSQFFERVSMHIGIVDHFWASALITADRRHSFWNQITDRTYAPPFGKRGGWMPFNQRWLKLFRTRCCTLRRAKNTPTRLFVYIWSRCAVNLERGDTVQVTMQKPYIKYKINSSSRSWDICCESFHYGKHEKF